MNIEDDFERRLAAHSKMNNFNPPFKLEIFLFTTKKNHQRQW